MSSMLDVATNAPTRRIGRSTFYVGMSSAFLLIVLVGFAPTLYLRSLFQAAPLTPELWVHGVVMTAWYVGALMQASLIAGRRADLHRRLGWALVGVGIAVLAVGTAVDMTFVPRRLQMGMPVAAIVGIVWSDRAALLSFAIFGAGAVALRRRPEAHKRLMLLASISVLQPAMSRIWRWPVFDDVGIPPMILGLSALSLLIAVIAANDLRTLRRLHPVTVLGGAFFLVSKIVFVYVIARTISVYRR